MYHQTAGPSCLVAEQMPSEVEVRESVIEGLGVFALRVFREGERIRRGRHEREITPRSPLLDGELLKHCSYPDGRMRCSLRLPTVSSGRPART